MKSFLINSYDTIPYESGPFSQTHPEHLATVGCLFGMAPAPANRCRVLELGCASGGNLIPMAYNLPGSVFVGVDLSGRQVAEGQRVIKDLDLSNIHIEQANIMDVDASWGMFDYIITHGVYSWVPEPVKDKILNVSKANLSPQGIAYVSYNTYPGWHMREMVRHMMLYHANQFDCHQERIEQARALMDFLAEAVSTDNNPFALLLEKEFSLIQNSKDSYLFHDHLEDFNSPVYFYQFVEKIGQYGLQYLGEADVGAMLTNDLPSQVSETLGRISQNIINTEQYLDFLRNRFFRQTLLCHQSIELRRELRPRHISDMLVASSAQPEKEPVDLAPNIIQTFQASNSAVVESSFPLTKSAMVVLAKHWPKALPFEELFITAIDMIPHLSDYDVEEAKERLLADILHCFAANTLELHTWQADFITEVSERPKSSPLACYFSANQKATASQRHELAKLNAIASNLLPMMDGSRDHSALLEVLDKCVQDGSLVVERDNDILADKEQLQRVLVKAMDHTLQELAETAMLVA